MSAAEALPRGIIGHRGARAVRPENSLSGFEYAARHGVRAVEMDVRLSKDERLVCSHDASTRRLGGPATLVSEMTVEQLGRLVLRGGVSVPTLDDVMDALSARVELVIEIKNDPGEPDFHVGRRSARALADLIEQRSRQGRDDHIRNVSSFDHESASVFASSCPRLAGVAALLAPVGVSPRAALDEACGRGLRHVHLHYSALVRRPAFVSEAADRGASVACWTVNSTAIARVLQKVGVTMVITDDPLRLAAVWRDVPSAKEGG